MYRKITLNDFKKNKLVTVVIFMFVMMSTLLISLATIMLVTLSGSTENLMKEAKTSHFLQMHSGALNEKDIAKFARNNSEVADYQLSEFLNLENSKMIFNEHSLIDSVEDNGVSVQNEKFDYLLDLDGKKIQAIEGEIYAPVSYLKSGDIKVGDTANLYGNKLKVVGFLRDSQMNSTLSSSKRFLVNESDYEKLKEHGNGEYLIEFRLFDEKKIGEFETKYIESKLPSNGPTVTYPLFKLMNGLTDGLMIAIMLLISFLVIIVGLLSIRFTLTTQLEADMKEIATLKAIGITIKDIKKIYLSKYGILVGIGGVSGFCFSLLLKEQVLGNIKLFMGEGNKASLSILLALLCVTLVCMLILLYVNRTLKFLKKVSAIEGMNNEKAIVNNLFSKKMTLEKSFLKINSFLGLKDLFIRSKTYLTMVLVLIVATFIFIVPMKLYQTVSSEDFSTYVGVGHYDFRMDIQQTDNIDEKVTSLVDTLDKDETITEYILLTTKSFDVYNNKGEVAKLRIELGDHTLFPLSYIAGREPRSANEIALSAMNADDLEKEVGDTILLEVDGKKKEVEICGIYSDLTNGGKTAKATFSENTNKVMWYTVNGNVSNKTNVSTMVESYKEQFDFAKISDVQTFVNYVYGTTIKGILILSYISIVLSVCLTGLMMSLFIKMLIEKDKPELATLKAIGFTTRDLVKQYITRFTSLSLFSISLGTLLSNTLGQKLASLLISNFGVSSFRFSQNGWVISLICLLVLSLVVVLTTIISVKSIKNISIANHIKG